MNISRPIDSPKIVLTELHREFNELYFIWWGDGLLRQQIEESQHALTALADEMLTYYDAYPEGINDRELVTLSYMLPPVLSTALLRHRLVKGMALRDMARWKGNATVED